MRNSFKNNHVYEYSNLNTSLNYTNNHNDRNKENFIDLDDLIKQ